MQTGLGLHSRRAREDMDDILKVPAAYRKDGRLDQFDFILYDGIQSFNQHRDLLRLYGVIKDCYPKGIPNLLRERSSLGLWFAQDMARSSRCYSSDIDFSNSAIREFLIDSRNREALNRSCCTSDALQDVMFLSGIYKVLDVLEGYTATSDAVIAEVKSVVESPGGCSGSSNKECICRTLCKCFQNCGLELFDIRVCDVVRESDNFVRLFFEATNFHTGRTHTLWSEVPVGVDKSDLDDEIL